MSEIPGEIRPAQGSIELNADREQLKVTVQNTGDRPVQIGSHFHFAEVNSALDFDRAATHGFRLDIPAGTAVRFEPGASRTVDLVALAGNRVVPGLQLKPESRPTPSDQLASSNRPTPEEG